MKNCSCLQNWLCDDTICIIDFAGNNTQPGEWADWCPHQKTVYFGGRWANIPDWKIDECPSEDDVEQYIAKMEKQKK